MQPLEVSFFNPLKSVWRRFLSKWKKYTKRPLNKDAFPLLLKQALQKIEKKEQNIKNGFKFTGLIPFNPHEVLKNLKIMDGHLRLKKC